MSPYTRHLVFAFQREGDALVALGPVAYPSAGEAEDIATQAAKTIPLIAGVLAMSLSLDPGTGDLLDTKVLKAFGEFSLAAVIDRLT
jgi:hypothetical protein